MSILAGLLSDLEAESADLDARVGSLPAAHWARLTPAEGWTIAHQIAHLAWTDHMATLAATDRDAFYAGLNTAFEDPEHFVDRGTESFLAPPPELLERWRTGRAALASALAAAPPSAKLPWYGTSMSRASMATARIMETWAHGQDVADTLGHRRAPTDRLRHIAHLGFRTLGHSFLVNGRDLPTAPVRVELVGPSGLWEYGPDEATDRVVGPALDFCLLVTQRRHRADLALVATGSVADEWLDIAQAFAGPPGAGREPTGARS
ncbi:TIGR03084 family metal-binding protein [Phytohabitans houttuyneae]|uniref:TIGR03084 family protein n=1 Tax=Phytohabitans houttuyneae TaxID=1076126 RepID=A0A6V8K9I0_9ACTN|nr:TIGR03084 family metal-binding protein [Phytohabitans houttuyneae]GFJ80140.1 TIGR03084 family protein [Phytohabitans houttuyneae]